MGQQCTITVVLEILEGMKCHYVYIKSVVNPAMFAWGSHSDWDGRHTIGTNEPLLRGLVTMASGESVFQEPVSWLARN